MLTSTFTRSRVIYFIMILIVIGLGLASRRYSEVLPDFISRYAGDTLWALMVFLVIGFLFPSRSTWKVAVIALLFSLLIEASQLYHAPWLEEIRRYRLAALILGRGFLWSDLGCYSVGVTLGILLEKLIINMNYRINAIKLRIKHKHK
jgi:glycopeptide antibiotics resistance protein